MTTAAPERDYARAIVDALGIERPRDSVAKVKDVVMAEIKEADSHVSIMNTQYFNHTYSPDFVLTWRRESSVERYVYLRFNDNLRYMYESMNHMQGSEPIVFGLSAFPFDREDKSVLDWLPKDSQALVTDPVAIGTLVHKRKNEPILGLVSAAVVQGGRGLLDQEAAELTSNVVSGGFKGARNLSVNATGAATEIIDKTLNGRQSNLDRLWCRACAVQYYQPTVMEYEQEELTGWVLDRGLVGLKGNDFVAYVAEHAEEVRRARELPSSGRGITVEELRSRARGIILSSLRLSDGRDSFELGSETNKDVAQGERLTALEEAFGHGARVQEAHANLESGQQLTVDFREYTAIGIGNSKLPLGQLLRTAVPLLWELDESAIFALRLVTEVPVDVGLFSTGLFSDQPTLLVEDEPSEDADS
ncbi:MAG: hypothetical protein LC776_17215 [Acidobacteria bacterium]|nr:hypothetical protein [Acidobacteriota bacterium]